MIGISIFDSEFDDHVMKHHHYKDSSCLGFHRRIIVGSHYSKTDQVRKFASTRLNAFRVCNDCYVMALTLKYATKAGAIYQKPLTKSPF